MEVFDIPKLDPSSRSREYKDRTYDEISEIVYIWLFHDNQGHREIDASVLGLDPLVSKGWQSMGVLHYLGLKKQFKALFQGHSLDFAINSLARDSQDFSPIIELLEMRNQVLEQLYVMPWNNTGCRVLLMQLVLNIDWSS